MVGWSDVGGEEEWISGPGEPSTTDGRRNQERREWWSSSRLIMFSYSSRDIPWITGDIKPKRERESRAGNERPGRGVQENHAWMCIVSSGWAQTQRKTVSGTCQMCTSVRCLGLLRYYRVTLPKASWSQQTSQKREKQLHIQLLLPLLHVNTNVFLIECLHFSKFCQKGSREIRHREVKSFAFSRTS